MSLIYFLLYLLLHAGSCRALRGPPFTFITPQLDVPDEAFIHRVGAQLQERYSDASSDRVQDSIIDCSRFLLFPWRTPGTQFNSQDDKDRWRTGPRTRLLDDRAGLYLTPGILHSHVSTLLLPLRLGGNSHVLRGDGATVERPGQDVLYQHGRCNPFIPDHGTPLAAILVNWWEQVGNDYWSVDENGVVGREECWRKADTEDYAVGFKVEWAC
jgi:hypothetical protein